MQNWAILLTCILCFKLNISARMALCPQDHWSIPLLNMEPYWHWQQASLHSRLSICLINSIYFKYRVIDKCESRTETIVKWQCKVKNVYCSPWWSKKATAATMKYVYPWFYKAEYSKRHRALHANIMHSFNISMRQNEKLLNSEKLIILLR